MLHWMWCWARYYLIACRICYSGLNSIFCVTKFECLCISALTYIRFYETHPNRTKHRGIHIYRMKRSTDVHSCCVGCNGSLSVSYLMASSLQMLDVWSRVVARCQTLAGSPFDISSHTIDKCLSSNRYGFRLIFYSSRYLNYRCGQFAFHKVSRQSMCEELW